LQLQLPTQIQEILLLEKSWAKAHTAKHHFLKFQCESDI
jgi:hypothetical protein